MNGSRKRPAPRPLFDRVWSRVAVSGQFTGCWLWTGGRDRGGYGRVNLHGQPGATQQTISAHRWMFQEAYGRQVVAGLVLDHTCHVRACVNPLHMEEVTTLVNSRERNPSPKIKAMGAPTCVHGHPYTVQSTYARVDHRGVVRRFCRPCHTLSERRYRAARALAAEQKW